MPRSNFSPYVKHASQASAIILWHGRYIFFIFMICNQPVYGFFWGSLVQPFKYEAPHLGDTGSIPWRGHYTGKLGQPGLKASILSVL